MKEFDSKVAENDACCRAIEGKGATLEQVAKIFASTDNWYTVNAPRGEERGGEGNKDDPYCHWAWKGPFRPPYEVAQNALRQAKRDKEQAKLRVPEPPELPELPVPYEVYVVVGMDREGKPRGVEKISDGWIHYSPEEAREHLGKLEPEVRRSFCVAKALLSIVEKL